jgi:hypothetical protein
VKKAKALQKASGYKWHPLTEKPKDFADGTCRWVILEYFKKSDANNPQPFMMAYWETEWKCWIDSEGRDPVQAYKCKLVRWTDLPWSARRQG